jgi:hypothetical protein
MFSWTEAAASDEIAAFVSELTTMPDHVPGILRYEHGDDLQLGSGTADYVLVADFATVEDYRAYSSHPHHVAFSETRVKPILAEVHRVQYHVP